MSASYLGLVGTSGRRSEELSGSRRAERGCWYLGTGEEVESVGRSLTVWIANAVDFWVEFGPDGREVRASRDWSKKGNGQWSEVIVALAVVDTEYGLRPAKYEMRLAQTAIYRAADQEMSEVLHRPWEWTKKSAAHQRASQEITPWWRFCVRAFTELRTSKNDRQYFNVQAQSQPTREEDLGRLREAWSLPEWQTGYRLVESSVYSRVNYLFDLC